MFWIIYLISAISHAQKRGRPYPRRKTDRNNNIEKRADNPMQRAKRHFYDDIFPEELPVDLALLCGSAEAQADWLNDALATGDAGAIAAALGVVARLRGMSALAGEVGVKRQQLYRALDIGGNPTLRTLTAVIAALGFRLSVEPRPARFARRRGGASLSGGPYGGKRHANALRLG